MRKLKNLDINKSIQKEKLIYDENWLDKFDTFTNYLMFFSFIFPSIFALKYMTLSANNNLEYLLYSCILIFGLYGFYCKFTEKDLKEIKFSIHKEEAKQRIIEYGKKYNYRISKISNNLIFLNEPTDSLSFQHCEKTTIIFFREQSIFYTLINEGSRINRPVLISQHITRMDLRKILSLKKNEIQTKRNHFSLFFFKD